MGGLWAWHCPGLCKGQVETRQGPGKPEAKAPASLKFRPPREHGEGLGSGTVSEV